MFDCWADPVVLLLLLKSSITWLSRHPNKANILFNKIKMHENERRSKKISEKNGFCDCQSSKSKSKLSSSVWPDLKSIVSLYGFHKKTLAQKHTNFAKALSKVCQILYKHSKCCQISLNFGQNVRNFTKSGHTGRRRRWWWRWWWWWRHFERD